MTIKQFAFGFALLTALAFTVSLQAQTQAPTIERLQAALAEDPDNYALHYYLGVLYNREGNTRRAFEQWSEYVVKAPFNRRTVTVREQLTVLRQRLAAERAREVTTGAVTLDTADNSIAILEFQNPDRPELRPLAKGLNAMIITDISKVEGLTVVERTQAQALMQEMQLAQSGIADAETSGRVGRLLAAQTIDWGRIDLDGDEIVIDNIVSDTANSTTIDDFTVSSPQSDFFALQKQIVFQILRAMGIEENDLDSETLDALQEIDTQSFEAFQAFGEGLVFLDEGNFSAARSSFEQAATLDPEFDLAQEAAVETPSDDVAVVESALGFDWDEETEEEATDESEEETDAVATVDEAVTETEVDAETETTSDLAQQEILVETENADTGGPRFDGSDGFATGFLANTEGEFHGLFANRSLESLTDVTLEGSAFPPSSARVTAVDSNGDGQITAAADTATLAALQVSDSFPDNPISSGIPQDLELTQLGESEFLTWGLWSVPQPVFRDPADGVPPAALGYEFQPLNFFIGGDATTPDQIASLASLGGTATYSGTAVGTSFGQFGEGIFYMGGTFTAVVDITALAVTDFDLNITSGFSSLTINNASGALDTATSTVSMTNGSWIVNGTPIDNAATQFVNLSVFGPEADEAAGNFGIDPDGSGQNVVGGIFQGDTETTLASGIFLAAPVRDENGTLLGGLVASTAVEDPNIWGGVAVLKASTSFDETVRLADFTGTQTSIFQVQEIESGTTSTYNASVFDLNFEQVTLNAFTHFSINTWNGGPVERRQTDAIALDAASYNFDNGFALLGDFTSNLSSLGLTDTQAGYTGPAYASISTAPGSQLTGNFTAFIDFAALAVTDLDISVANADVSFTIEDASGTFNDEFGIALGLGSGATIGGTFDDQQFNNAFLREDNIRLQLFGPDASEAGGTFQSVYYDDFGNPVSLISGAYGGAFDPDLAPAVPPKIVVSAPISLADGTFYDVLEGRTSSDDTAFWTGGSASVQDVRLAFSGEFGSILPLTQTDFSTTPETIIDYAGSAIDVDWTSDILTTFGGMTIARWTDPAAGSQPSPSLADFGQGYLFDGFGLVAYGPQLTVVDLASLGTEAYFTGPAYGYSSSAPDDLMTGSFNAIIDFTTLAVLDFDLAIASATRNYGLEDLSSEIIGGSNTSLGFQFFDFEGKSFNNFVADDFGLVLDGFSDGVGVIEVFGDGSEIAGYFDELFYSESGPGTSPVGAVYGVFGGARDTTLVAQEILLQLPVLSTTGEYRDLLLGGRLDSQAPFRWFGITNLLTPGKEVVVEGNFGEITTAYERNRDVTPEERLYYNGGPIDLDWTTGVIAQVGAASIAEWTLPTGPDPLAGLGDGYTFGSGFVVYGNPSTVADLASLGANATYTGSAWGYSSGAPDDLLTGQVVAQIDFVSQSIDQFDIALTSATRNYGVLIIPQGSPDTSQPSFGRLSLSNADNNFRGIDFTSDFGVDVASAGFQLELEVFGNGSTIAGIFSETFVDATTQAAAGSFFGAFGATREAPAAVSTGSILFPVFDASGGFFELSSGSLGSFSSSASAFRVTSGSFDTRRLRFIGTGSSFINVRAEDVPAGVAINDRIRKYYTGPEISFRSNETILFDQGGVQVTSWVAPNGGTALLDIDDIGYQFSQPGFAVFQETNVDFTTLVGVIGYSGEAFAYSSTAPDDLMSGTFNATIDYTADQVLDLDVSVSSATRSYSFVNAASGEFDNALRAQASGADTSISFLSEFEQGGQPVGVTNVVNVGLNPPTADGFLTGTFEQGIGTQVDPATGVSAPLGVIYGALAGQQISGPQQEQGYWANAAVADNGAFHGVFLTDGVQDLNSWSATGSAFAPASATGTLDQITTLQISDGFPDNPLIGGLPNAVSFSETIGVSEFMEWGGWSDTDPMSREPQTGLAPGQISYTFSPIGYYLYGQTTTQTDIASLGGVATYSGAAYGTHYASPNEVMTGSFSGEIDFVATELLSFALSISSPSHSLSFDNGGVAAAYQFPGTNGGQAAFTPQNVIVDGVSVGTPAQGNTYFTLYGPGAEEAGGVFFVDPDGVGTDAIHGMFRGVRQ